MKRKKGIFDILVLGLFCFPSSPSFSQAQSTIYNEAGWQLKDYRDDAVFGAGVTRAYEKLLKNRKPVPVIVAVIDVGMDTAHPDLLGHLWTNIKEIPGNGIDDDHNGYTDDVHGWNFIGGINGRDMTVDSYESYREYRRLQNRTPVSGQDSNYYLKVKKYFQQDSAQQAHTVLNLSQVLPKMRSADSLLKSALHKDSIYARDLIVYHPQDSLLIQMKNNSLIYFKKYGLTTDMPLGRFVSEANNYLQNARIKLQIFSGDPDAQRREIVGDDYNDFDDRRYGNNHIWAGDPAHGTHVAGIIAAIRGNSLGLDGISDEVLIMPVRAVPDGDERDKDIGRAIRYAVDNGARIINMSFGKYFSPGKKWVDEAVKYAGDHDVLLVHAAGNESRNIDSIPEYPNPLYEPDAVKEQPTVAGGSCCFITVGANSGGPDSLVLARFSNYGKKEVDLFAPGVKIFSTLPANQYAIYSGTSMAAPVVSGIAALIMEYYPGLSARQVKNILLQSVMKFPEIRVKRASDGRAVDFGELSVTGGIVNAYNALLLAEKQQGERLK